MALRTFTFSSRTVSLSVRTGGLHRQVAENLEKMILHDVTNGAGLVVKGTATLDAEVLGHSDLDTIDEVAVPKGFHEGVSKTEHEHIVDRPLAEIVVDSEDVLFLVSTVKNLVECLRGDEVITEWFFNDDTRASGTARFHQLFNDFTK